jgi:hypothetical protein
MLMTHRYNSVNKSGDSFRSGVRTVSFYIALSNKISKELYVPYFYHRKLPDENILRQVQKIYNLPTLYIFKTGNNYTTISCRPVSKQRCKKIMKAVKSNMWKTFTKYSKGTFCQLWIRTSRIKNEQLQDTEPIPKLVKIIENNIIYSQSEHHYNFIKRYCKIPKMPIQIQSKRKNMLSKFKMVKIL